jgi:hypothetical protein
MSFISRDIQVALILSTSFSLQINDLEKVLQLYLAKK